MSEPYQLVTLIPDGIEASRAIAIVSATLARHEGTIDDDSYLYLADWGDREFEPEPVSDGSDALQRLAAHPTLGCIDYAMPEAITNVAYYGGDQRVQAIAISIPQRSFDKGGEATRKRYIAIANELHQALEAKRTLLDWGPVARGLRWDEEVVRLRKNQFEGTYEIADLQAQAGVG